MSAKAISTRRFCLPLFSIRRTTMWPISPVLATCVPPHACTSASPTRTNRARAHEFGPRVEVRVGDPLARHVERGIDERVDLRLDRRPVCGRGRHVEVEPGRIAADRAARDRIGQHRRKQMAGGVHAHVRVAPRPIEHQAHGRTLRGSRRPRRQHVHDLGTGLEAAAAADHRLPRADPTGFHR